ncbi:MAG: DUF3159 domain-containing protein [Phycicoccus sp.]|nr:DUF3159 domain-containing protein [Phycicoccus sp.]
MVTRAPGDITAHTVETLIRERLSSAVGGARGSLETALPTIAFVAAWMWRHDVKAAVVASAVIVLILLVVRLASRQTPRYVLSAVLATAIAAYFALRSGRAEAAFLPGILTSAAWGVGSLLSVMVRWPIVGFIVAAGDPHMAEDPTAWRRDGGLVRVCQKLTMVLVLLYAVRVVVMFPLYLAGQVTLLGVAKIALGWPAYLCALAVMGMILVRGKTPLTPSEPLGTPEPLGSAEPLV